MNATVLPTWVEKLQFETGKQR